MHVFYSSSVFSFFFVDIQKIFRFKQKKQSAKKIALRQKKQQHDETRRAEKTTRRSAAENSGVRKLSPADHAGQE